MVLEEGMDQAWLLAEESGVLVLVAEEGSAPWALSGSGSRQNTLEEKMRLLVMRTVTNKSGFLCFRPGLGNFWPMGCTRPTESLSLALPRHLQLGLNTSVAD